MFFTFLLIFSGILDLFPIYNDNKIILPDYSINNDISWIIKNTNPNSVFLNTQYLYDNASLAGRKIFLGWPYFSWSQGYDTNRRFSAMSNLLGSSNKNDLCKLLSNNRIDYIELSRKNFNDPNLPKISNTIDKEFIPIFNDNVNSYSIYKVATNCKK